MLIVPFFIIIPLATAFVVPIMAKLDERLQDALAVVSSLAIFVLSAVACISLGKSASGVMAYKLGNLMPPAGIALIIDGLSVFMLVTVNLVAFFIATKSISDAGNRRAERHMDISSEDCPKYVKTYSKADS